MRLTTLYLTVILHGVFLFTLGEAFAADEPFFTDDKAKASKKENPEDGEEAETLKLQEDLDALENEVQVLKRKLEALQEKNETQSKASEKAGEAFVKRGKKLDSVEQRVEKTEKKQNAFDAELAELKEKGIEISGDVALDFAYFQDGQNQSQETGFAFRELNLVFGYEIDNFSIEMNPTYDGYSNSVDIATAFFDIALVKHKVKEDKLNEIVEMVSEKNKTWLPAAPFGRGGAFIGRRNDVFLAVQIGKILPPIGVGMPFDFANDRYTITKPLHIEETYDLVNDIGFMLYGNQDWVNYAAFLVNGRLDGIGGGARIGFTPMEKLELAVSYLCEVESLDDDSSFQLVTAELYARFWVMDLIAQYTFEQEKTEKDDLRHFGAHLEARWLISPVYLFLRGGLFHEGGEEDTYAFDYRASAGLGWWAIEEHLTFKLEYNYNTMGSPNNLFVQGVAYF